MSGSIEVDLSGQNVGDCIRYDGIGYGSDQNAYDVEMSMIHGLEAQRATRLS